MKGNNKSNKTINIATFNVRGLTMKSKQERLISDIKKYKIDVCCLQETKIAKSLDIDVKECRLMCLP